MPASSLFSTFLWQPAQPLLVLRIKTERCNRWVGRNGPGKFDLEPSVLCELGIPNPKVFEARPSGLQNGLNVRLGGKADG
jgi:hypothetical protein